MEKKFRTTSEFAEPFGVKGASVRRAYCVNGHYMGVRPIKLPNGRLLWPAVDPEEIASEQGADSSQAA